MAAVDQINQRQGRGTVRIGRVPAKPSWALYEKSVQAESPPRLAGGPHGKALRTPRCGLGVDQGSGCPGTEDGPTSE
nr:DUF4113 domain-containing protein [Pseudomonas otitidis]